MMYWDDVNIFGFTVHEAVVGMIVTYFFMLAFAVGIGMMLRLLHDVTIRYPKFISFFAKKIW